MVEQHLKKTQKILIGCVGVVALGFVGLVMFWIALTTVGYLNMAVSYWSLKPLANLAMTYPLEPGQSIQVEPNNGALVAERFGRISIQVTSDGARVVTFDRGGGHLGVQGYIYAPAHGGSHDVHQERFGDFESREVSYLFGDWYTYDSTEE